MEKEMITPAMRADAQRQPVMTQAEADAKWARVQTDIVVNEPALAEALWPKATD